MTTKTSTLLLVLLLVISLSCQDDEEVVHQDEQSVSINGYVQKGPFINGTAITASELDGDLVATGRNFTTQIIDNKGSFSLKDIELQSSFVQLIAEGFYFDEVQGEKSAAQLTLFALADVSDASSVNVNLLSHLEKDRVTYLMQEEELSFATAKQQAQQEILAIFGIEKADMTVSELLDISQDGEDNAILLAVSAILQGNNTVAELSELLANIITDIREDGVLNSESTSEKIRTNAMSLDLADIRQHLENRYEELGVDATIANFEQYVDSDGDGFLNKDEDDTPDDFAFEAQMDVAINDTVNSNIITISGLKEGSIARALVTKGGLVVNGSVLPTNTTGLNYTDTLSTAQVKNGDQLQIALKSSSQFATVTSASLTIGSIVRNFKVTTDDYSPDSFSFDPIENAAPGTTFRTETLTLTGLKYASPIVIEGGVLFVNGQEVPDKGHTVQTGDQITVELFSGHEYETTNQAKLSIGTFYTYFIVKTNSNSWQRKVDFPVHRRTFLQFSIENKVYVGGYEINGELNKDLYVYDPSSHSYWRVIGEIPFTIGWNRTAVADNKAYSLYGSELWEYNPLVFQWTQKSSPNLDLENDGQVVGCNGKIYYLDFLGSATWEYSPSSDTWQKKETIPFSGFIDYSTTFSLDANVYVVSPSNVYEPAHSEVWEYNTTNGVWTQKNHLSLASLDASSFVTQNRAYFLPGSELGEYASYDQATDEWEIIHGKPDDYPIGISSSEKGYAIEYSKFYEFTPPQE